VRGLKPNPRYELNERKAMKATRKTRRATRRLFRLCRVNGRVDPDRVRLVARRIAQSGHRGTIAILADFSRLVRLDRDEHHATVESATPLADDLRKDVQAGLDRAYGEGLDTSFELNPQLIGGMRIQVGSDVYDASVRAKLAALEARL
jgi:F-type H+-transporting ATPase subunit delta